MTSKTANSAPFSLRVNDAAEHFGLKAPTLYQWVSQGRLLRGKHYLKVGGRVVIIREAFIEFMFKEDGTNVGENQEQAALS